MKQKKLIVVTATVILLLDRISKLYTHKQSLGQFNEGGILGLAPDGMWVWIMIGILTYVLYQLFSTKLNKFQAMGWSVIGASGLSNLIDRLMWGAVWDWIYYPFIQVVGNLADVMLGIGVIILLTENYYQPDKKKLHDTTDSDSI